MSDKITVLGIMSGSSLDGLDVCLVSFQRNNKWSYEILKADTYPIPEDLKQSLRSSPKLSKEGLNNLDHEYGEWIGAQVVEHSLEAELIGVHGHTVFHEPSKGFSLQIGHGRKILEATGKLVISDFRNQDIQLGGQGAPLVPKGEMELFPEFDSFLNLGGICNATIRKNDTLLAGDIGPFNQVFNHHANILGYPFDEGGKLAASGKIKKDLLSGWKNIDYFHSSFPKSLSNQWVSEHFLNDSSHRPEDIMHSFAEFITDEISQMLNSYDAQNTLVTGGGAYNKYVINLLKEKTNSRVCVPEQKLVEYKEALIFAFLGLLRFLERPNVLSSCTGAKRDSSSGVIFS